MVRSMYSGVSGLRSHQTRMDTIGNNIANVNTYGFKSGRTTFRDIYYQQMRSASQPTAAVGGMNPSAVGYGAQVGSVDLMMGRSTFTMTDNGMDLAIDGEGFFQVQDQAGNTYYTRAGMIGFDAAGNLVDMQGNFVLGINGDPTGIAPASQRIQVVLPPVPPTAASTIQTINGNEFTMTAQNPTTDGNLNFNFGTDSSLADGEVVAVLSSTGIIIKMHPDNVYTSLAQLNTEINDAITKANNGQPHPGGTFTISYTGPAADDPFAAANMPEGGYKASEIVSVDYSVNLGSVDFLTNASLFGGVYPSGNVGTEFGSEFVNDPGNVTSFTCTYNDATQTFHFEMVIDGVTYDGDVDSAKGASGRFMLRNAGSSTDYIELVRPSFGGIQDAYEATAEYATTTFSLDAVAAANATITVDGTAYTVPDPAPADVPAQLAWLAREINEDSGQAYTAKVEAGELVLTAKEWGTGTAPAVTTSDAAVTIAQESFVDGANPVFPAYTGADLGDGTNPATATATGPSNSLGFSATGWPLRGGTEGGPQTVADMTNINFAPDGTITGQDAQGLDVVIGRIILATFANPGGLNQAGASNYSESVNSGEAQLAVPGMNGSGKLVKGSLELSNVDLSREFSDMITTQRGYQANSRIITVSDTMLEELINLKR